MHPPAGACSHTHTHTRPPASPPPHTHTLHIGTLKGYVSVGIFFADFTPSLIVFIYKKLNKGCFLLLLLRRYKKSEVWLSVTGLARSVYLDQVVTQFPSCDPISLLMSSLPTFHFLPFNNPFCLHLRHSLV